MATIFMRAKMVSAWFILIASQHEQFELTYRSAESVYVTVQWQSRIKSFVFLSLTDFYTCRGGKHREFREANEGAALTGFLQNMAGTPSDFLVCYE
jgi:hypothetical protein